MCYAAAARPGANVLRIVVLETLTCEVVCVAHWGRRADPVHILKP